MNEEFAGSLTQRIVIEQLDEERTVAGLSSGRWASAAECRACVIPEGAGAEAEGMSFSGMPRMRFLIRANEMITVRQRVRWRNRAFQIRQIAEDPRLPDRIELRCEEVRA